MAWTMAEWLSMTQKEKAAVFSAGKKLEQIEKKLVLNVDTSGVTALKKLLEELSECVKDEKGDPLVCHGCRNSAADVKFPGKPSYEMPCYLCVRNPQREWIQSKVLEEKGEIIASWPDDSPLVSYPMDCYLPMDMAEQMLVWATLAGTKLPPVKSAEIEADLTEEIMTTAGAYTIQVKGPQESNELNAAITSAINDAIQKFTMLKAGLPVDTVNEVLKYMNEMVEDESVNATGEPTTFVVMKTAEGEIEALKVPQGDSIITPTGVYKGVTDEFGYTSYVLDGLPKPFKMPIMAEEVDSAVKKSVFGPGLAEEIKKEMLKSMNELMAKQEEKAKKSGAENSKPPKKLMLGVKNGSWK